MRKKVVNIIRGQRNLVLGSFIGLSIALTGISCDKKDESVESTFVVSTSEQRSDAVSKLDVDIEGGKYTLYVFSSSDVNVSFQTAEVEKWVTVDEKEYISALGATRLVLDVQPLTEGYKIRSGVLDITNQEKYTGSFMKISQGYESRFTEDFAWLKYGNGNPLDLLSGTLIDNWSTAQKQNGWTSTVFENQDGAFVYGKNGYVQLGGEDVGADFKSKIIPSIDKDSILLLTFNAVSYISRDGVKDDNKLTVKIVGAEFEDGGDTRVVELGYYDYLSALLLTKMWDNSKYSFKVQKPKNNPASSTIQLQFVTDADTKANRVFLDNVSVYSVAKFENKK